MPELDFDWCDELALQIMTEVHDNKGGHLNVRKSIAARLRVIQQTEAEAALARIRVMNAKTSDEQHDHDVEQREGWTVK